MSFYSLSKPDRIALVNKIDETVFMEIERRIFPELLDLFSNEDTYIRKAGYLAVGKAYLKNRKLISNIQFILSDLIHHENFLVRQATVNAAGEIGKTDFQVIESIFDTAIFDKHHSVRNAVIGSLKKMGEKNPQPILDWSGKYLHHPDKEVRREIAHGIELRGRTHPEEILPMLKELEFDKTARVRNMVVHVLGQISYKEGCLQKVLIHLKTWENKPLVEKAIAEIIDVHDRYKDFAVLTQEQAIKIIATENI
jgi:hypothetical protein